MNNRLECDECRAIIEELMRVLADLRELDPKLKDEFRARCEALFGMMYNRRDTESSRVLVFGERLGSPFRRVGPKVPNQRGLQKSHVSRTLKSLLSRPELSITSEPTCYRVF
jgi:hypothetical protein